MKDRRKSRSKGRGSLEGDLDRAFSIQDRWLISVLLPTLAGIGAALLLGRHPPSPVRELLIALLFVSIGAAAALLGIWLIASLSYRRKLNRFRSARGLPIYGPHGFARAAVYAAAVLTSGGLGILYFATPSLRSAMWVAFLIVGATLAGFVWLRRRQS